jgi:hypothetical protein
MSKHNLVEVYRAKDAPAAHLLKSALEEAGISAIIEGELLQGALGEVPVGWSSSPRVLVNSGDAPGAREIIRQKEAVPADSSASLGDVCLSCGTPLGEEEETCPQCGWSYLQEASEGGTPNS